MKKFILLITVFMVLMPLKNVFAFEAYLSCDRTDVTLNETFNLKITIKGGSGRVYLPETDGIEYLSSSQSSNISMINGHVDETKIYNYTVLPVKEGKITIGPVKVENKSKSVLTNSLVINVVKDSKVNSSNISISAKAHLSDNHPYIGEYLEYKIVVSADETVVKIGFEEPEFRNFIAKRQKDRTYSKIIQGKAYNITEIVYSLLPSKSGKGVIAPCKIEAAVKYNDRSSQNRFSKDPFFNDPFFAAKTYSTKRKIIFSDKAEYEIKELPKTTLNSFYSNITGNIKAYSEVDKNEISMDDFINYKIVVEGRGNLSDLKLPEIDFSDGYKTYKDSPQINTSKSPVGEEGKIITKYAVVPSGAGEFELPEFKLRFFNPDAEQWEEILIEKQKFKVKGRHLNKNADAAIPNKPAKPDIKKEKGKEKILHKGDENFVKKDNNRNIIFIKESKGSFFSSRPDYKKFFKIYIGVGVLIFFSFLFIRNLNKVSLFLKNNEKKILKRLMHLTDYDDLKKAASYIKNIFNDLTLEKYNKNLNTYLLEVNQDKDFEIFIGLLEEIEFSDKAFDTSVKDLKIKAEYFMKKV